MFDVVGLCTGHAGIGVEHHPHGAALIAHPEGQGRDPVLLGHPTDLVLLGAFLPLDLVLPPHAGGAVAGCIGSLPDRLDCAVHLAEPGKYVGRIGRGGVGEPPPLAYQHHGQQGAAECTDEEEDSTHAAGL